MASYKIGKKNKQYSENKTNFIVTYDFQSIQNHIEKMLYNMKLRCFGYNPLLQQYWGKKIIYDQIINFCIQISNSVENNIHVSLIMQHNTNYHKDSQLVEQKIIQYIQTA